MQDLAAAKGFDYGSMVTWKSWDGDDAINRDDAFSQLVVRECGLIVSAMEMFWRLNSKNAGEMDFSGADALVDWGQKHGKKVRGHNLLWHGQTPGWYKGIGDKAYAEKMLVEHVSSMCGRYAGRMHSWDVVNEIFDPGSDRPDGLRRQRVPENPRAELCRPCLSCGAASRSESAAGDQRLQFRIRHRQQRAEAALPAGPARRHEATRHAG